MNTVTILTIVIINCIISFVIAGYIGHKVSVQLMNYYYDDKKENEKRFLVLESLFKSKQL